MGNGYIIISRDLINHEIFASEKLLKIWIWCILKANYKDRFVPFKINKGHTTIEIKRGQFIFGRFKAEEELFIDGSTIYKCLQKLKTLECIDISSNNQYSIITICNYDTYQSPHNYEVTGKEQPSNNQGTTKEQPRNTNKKDKQDNKDKKRESAFSFYNSEIEKNQTAPQIEKYIMMKDFLFGKNPLHENLENILTLPKQLTYEQFCEVLKRMPSYKKLGQDYLLQMENVDKYTNNRKSIYAILIKWFQMDSKNK